jgi:hypothetical protein
MNLSAPSPALADLLSSDAAVAGATPGKSLEQRAAQLADFALAEYGRIVELDVSRGRIALRYSDRQGALAMRRLYQQWSDEADQLLRRLKELGHAGQLGGRYDQLEHAVGRTLAMLGVTLESLERADRQIEAGQTKSIEEVRRELRAAAGR